MQKGVARTLIPGPPVQKEYITVHASNPETGQPTAHKKQVHRVDSNTVRRSNKYITMRSAPDGKVHKKRVYDFNSKGDNSPTTSHFQQYRDIDTDMEGDVEEAHSPGSKLMPASFKR